MPFSAQFGFSAEIPIFVKTSVFIYLFFATKPNPNKTKKETISRGKFNKKNPSIHISILIKNSMPYP